MPKCKNDPDSNYIGNEPSPKGLGFCAHAEKVNTIKKGRDGNIWIIKSNNNIKKWFKHNDNKKKVNDIVELLYNKMKKWWIKMTDGALIICFKNGDVKLIDSNKKTKNAKLKELKELHEMYGQDDNVKAIIWSGMSVDILYGFIYYILNKYSKAMFKQLVDSENILLLILDNFTNLFEKYKLFTSKDYTFKNKPTIDHDKIAKKLAL
uniref:Uncharacterized protein n=1 Tax=viral metagenome TaxID=1070528 RepID=A0A6C0LXZ6_9ZZZZ